MSNIYTITQEMIEANRKTVWISRCIEDYSTVSELISQLSNYPDDANVNPRMRYEYDSTFEVEWKRAESDDEVVTRLHNEHHSRLRKQDVEIALLKSLQEKYKDKEL